MGEDDTFYEMEQRRSVDSGRRPTGTPTSEVKVWPTDRCHVVSYANYRLFNGEATKMTGVWWLLGSFVFPDFNVITSRTFFWHISCANVLSYGNALV